MRGHALAMTERFNWEENGYSPIDQQTLELLKPILPAFTYPDTDPRSPEAFFFIDIDSDGTNEVIYNGCNGGEGDMLKIFRKSGDFYINTQTFMGRVSDVAYEGKYASFQVYDYSCCAGYVNHYITLDYMSDTGDYIITKDYALIDGSVKDYQPIAPVSVVVENKGYNMRDKPAIFNYTDNGVPFDPIEGQNIVAQFKKGDTGTALAEWADETGRVWWLVVMDRMPDKDSSIFYSGNNDHEVYKPVGWMSSRFLKVL